MRQLAHKLVGCFFWALMVALWIALVREGKAGTANFAYSAQYLGLIAGAVLAVTFWWIHHNMRVYRRKGPRSGRAELPPRLDEDRLGRPIRWQLDGGPEGVLEESHLVVALDGEAKVYRPAGY